MDLRKCDKLESAIYEYQDTGMYGVYTEISIQEIKNIASKLFPTYDKLHIEEIVHTTLGIMYVRHNS